MNESWLSLGLRLLIMRSLIVNADDCNLTQGVTRAILECHEKGIVSSTTWMVNRPTDSEIVAQVANSGLGVGLHLNVTSGIPISSPGDVASLVTDHRTFKKKKDYQLSPPAAGELIREYEKQIKLFEKHFGREPTHLDTHHQMHDEPVFFQALLHVARARNLPIRRSVLMRDPQLFKAHASVVTTQKLLGNLDAHAFWTVDQLERQLSDLLPGTTEVMCHPGIWDEELQAVTSMTVAREKERALFSSPHLKKVLEKHKIRLIHFGQLRS